MLCTCAKSGQQNVPTPQPAANPRPEIDSQCEPFTRWPGVKTTCGGCRALVATSASDGRCDRYCASFGHTCVGAAEEQDNNCEVKYSASCSQTISGTSDMLCSCARSAQQQPATMPTPQPSADQCSSFNQWPDVQVTCGGCRALVATYAAGGRCDRYCASFGHTCVSAAEEQDNDCNIKYSTSCDTPISGTSDMLCSCARIR